MKETTALFIYFLSCCSLILFLHGFFTLESNLNAYPKTSAERSNSVVRKLILVVIDAMRVDFVDPASSHYMPFLQKSIRENKSCFLTARAVAPTVTMPRIKALTSGVVPNYMDVVWNFGNQEFTQDTFLQQAVDHGLTAVFYGDDTWLKMFPNIFKRSVGTHSFFASDFWEVDKNITQHLEIELQKNNWDILILHYLGLDHIGHIEGPRSKHIPQKLAEMDAVINRLASHFNSSKDMLLVTSDHGMKDNGGHGGVTYSEIHVPLISVGRQCLSLPGWPEVREYFPRQTDIASTLSAALGLPTSIGNTGKLIPALLEGMSPMDILLRLQSDAEQLLQVYNLDNLHRESVRDANDILTQNSTNNSRLPIMEASHAYFNALQSISETIEKLRTEFNLNYLLIAIIGLVISLCTLISTTSLAMPSNTLIIFLVLGTMIHTLSLASSSFIEEEHQTWYFLWATFALLCLRNACRQYFQRKADYRKIGVILSLCALHRFSRSLNQTGDKWAALPDLHDFLIMHPLLHLLVFLSGISWLYGIFNQEQISKRSRSIFLIGLAFVTFYHLAVNTFNLEINLHYPRSRGKNEVLGFTCTFFVFLVLSHTSKLHSSWSWALLCSLLCRPHNLILIPMQILVSRFLHELLSNYVFWNSVAHVWLGALFYFYQGNSNSIANIDVAAGFIGAEEYNPWYAGFMTIANTFSAPILALLLAPQNVPAVLVTRLIPLTVYCILIFFQRYHLFVWSVFSPKLLLISFDFVLTFIVLFVIFLLNKFF